ncbi:hypothetical protein DSO57_1011026 [Entomophthora muscae]|uniref:Uncharacterized protein n=1 Tax=Entomophthora muscae TaxID=34485 RepID=A0ACC2S8F7_9FUNG|nr:hypothetical protein DSO57_1011026 [Entomophthora muscae]
MKAVQKSMEEHQKADREQEEELTNTEETGDFVDPSVLEEVKMDDGTQNPDRVIHPDLGDWQKSNDASLKSQKNRKINPHLNHLMCLA